MPGIVVLNPATVDGYGNPISVTRDDSIAANRLLTSTAVTNLPQPEAAKKVISVEFFKTNLNQNTNYFVAIDLDNAFGSYKHDILDGYVRLVGTSGVLIKAKNSDIWHAVYGCILEINSTQATIGYLQQGALYAADTNQFIDRYALQTFPVELDLTVVGGDYTKITVSETSVTTDINTLTTIKDAVGNNVVPAVGDVIVRILRVSGNGQASAHYSFWYYVE